LKVEGNGEKVGQLNFPLQTTSNNLPIGVSNLTYIQPFLFYKPTFKIVPIHIKIQPNPNNNDALRFYSEILICFLEYKPR
jgi:hypothetical protein